MENRNYLKTKNAIEFTKWADEWLKANDSLYENAREVKQQEIQKLQRKIEVRLGALLEMDDVVQQREKSLPPAVKEVIQGLYNEWGKKIEEKEEEIKSRQGKINELNEKLRKFPNDIHLKERIDKENDILKRCRDMVTKMEYQQQQCALQSVCLYRYLTPEETKFFEFLLEKFPEKKDINYLRANKIGTVDYTTRKQMLDYLEDIIINSENENCSVCILLGRNPRGIWGDYSDLTPCEEGFDVIWLKTFYPEIYNCWKPVCNKLASIQDILNIVGNYSIADWKLPPDNDRPKILDESFYEIMKKLNENLDHAIKNLEKYSELAENNLLDEDFRNIGKQWLSKKSVPKQQKTTAYKQEPV